MTRRAAIVAALVAAAAGSGCVTDRSILAPAGPAASPLAALGWPVLVGFTAVSLVMWALLAWVALRKRGSFDEHAPVHAKGGMSWVLVGGFVIPTVTFGVIFVMTLRTMAAVPMATPDTPPDIRVVGHQWWWEVQYLYGDLPQHVAAANEIHIPAGRPVEIELRSADVIHSLWVPRLAGKVDLIPGQITRMHVEASAPGVYPGGCAELCGMQHANMKVLVVADAPDEFERWLARERGNATPPETEQQRRGEQLFLHRACVTCHSIRGTTARASVGPDLTHLASRRTIAASLRNDTATLHAWVVNAPSLKPGTRMPALPEFRGDELHDLVAWLQHLE